MKKGFTLVELLAVIVILAIVLAIAIPSFTDLMSSSKKRAYIEGQQLLIRRAQIYLSINGLEPTTVGSSMFFNISDMINANMLPSDARDPITNQVIDVNDKIYVKKTDNNKYYYRFLQIGSILRETWTGITGTIISNLTSISAYPDKPNITNYPISFEAPTDFGDNYGTRMRGYIIPPVTGVYKFWISSDDQGELWLSTDESPANKALIAKVTTWSYIREWTKSPEQQSVDIDLEQGKIYYIEALHKENNGGDNFAIGWQIPGGSTIDVIAGQYLAPYLPE